MKITQELITETEDYIRDLFNHDMSGHDYYHVKRVVVNAKKICLKEVVNEETFHLVIISAWLHDLGDYKLNGGIDKSKELITDYLSDKKLDLDIIQNIVQIISEVSFSKGLKPTTQAAKIVQDADRLDAIGSIGIARCFAYGGTKGRPIFIPDNVILNKESSIQHFHDKLLLLKDMMNTKTAKQIAIKRHQLIEDFLNHFYEEVDL